MGGTCGVAREVEGPQGVSFCFVSSLGSLLLVGSVIHMQYNTHGLYFVKRNNEKDRFLFPWCELHFELRVRLVKFAAIPAQSCTQVSPLTSPHLTYLPFYLTLPQHCFGAVSIYLSQPLATHPLFPF